MSEFRYPANIAPLTGLRFFAALAVFLFHFQLFFGWPAGLCGRLASKAYLGVDFFFILSGFILMHVYAPRRFSARAFFTHRLARLYPLHALTLLLAAILSLSHAVGWVMVATPATFFANLLLIQSWGTAARYSFNFPAWSISAEWFAYLCFPFLLRLTNRAGPGRSALGAIWFYGFTVFLLHAVFHADLTRFSAGLSMLRVLPEFFLGMTLYTASAAHPWAKAPGLTLSFLFLLLLTALYANLPDFASILLFLPIIHVTAGIDRRRGADWLASRPLVYLGEVSFAFYMIHALVLYATWRLAPEGAMPSLWLAASCATTLVLAIAAHHALERPARRVLRRLDGTETCENA